jgi:hypothetical protein
VRALFYFNRFISKARSAIASAAVEIPIRRLSLLFRFFPCVISFSMSCVLSGGEEMGLL